MKNPIPLLVAALLMASAPAFARPPASPDANPAMRRRVFDLVWRTVGTGHYDSKMNGVDWNAVRKRYEGRAVHSKNEAAFYATLNAMLSELKQSHLGAISPGAMSEREGKSPAGETGETGITGEWIENLPVVARVQAGEPGATAGVKPGDEIVSVDGVAALPVLKNILAATPARYAGEERVSVWIALRTRLAGTAGRPMRLVLRDPAGRARAVTVTPRRSPDKMVAFGALPPLPIEIESRTLAGGVGYVRWNIFLFPLILPVKEAIQGFTAKNAPAIVLDLRGNPGGIGPMAGGISGVLLDKPQSLGTMRMRSATMRFPALPQEPVYSGPVFVLTDEGSISTSEIMAAGLQELHRAKVVGRTTAGMVLPSQIVTLPDGGRLQYVVADFRTPGGTLLEGRGVTPDLPVTLTRASLAASPDGDPILDAALAAIPAVPAIPATPVPTPTPTPTKPVPAPTPTPTKPVKDDH